MAASLFHVLNISRQDMLSKLNDLDGSANNLANSNTVGYKPVRSNFQELLDNMTYGGTLQTGSQVLTQQGTLKSTSNPMDVAIQGDGFFAVTYAAGKTGYSRDGQFSLDANNNLVNSSGFPLVWNGTIPVGAEEIQFQENGVVQTRIGDTWTQAGTIQLYRVPNPTGLQLNGNNVYITTTNSGTATSRRARNHPLRSAGPEHARAIECQHGAGDDPSHHSAAWISTEYPCVSIHGYDDQPGHPCTEGLSFQVNCR